MIRDQEQEPRFVFIRPEMSRSRAYGSLQTDQMSSVSELSMRWSRVMHVSIYPSGSWLKPVQEFPRGGKERQILIFWYFKSFSSYVSYGLR